MARKRSRTRKSETAEAGVQAVGLRSGGEGNSFLLTQLGQPIGVANVGRAFKVAQKYNGPQIALRNHYFTLPNGWTHGTISDQDYTCGTAMPANPLDPAYVYKPVTPSAEALVDEHWPILQSLLQSGLGTRYTTTMSEVIRYYNLVITAMERILFPLQLNYLTTSFDWTKVPPHSSVVPPAVWGLAELFDANDVGVNDIWKPLYDRLATKVLPPRLAAAVYEQAFPYVGHPTGSVVRLHHPGPALTVITAWDIGTYILDIATILDYLEDELMNCHNSLASFLPWRVSSPMAMFKGYDPIYEEVDYNTSTKGYAPFGDTGDPDPALAIVCGSAATDGEMVTYFHKGAAPLVKSVLHSGIWELQTHAIDDTFRVLTMAYGSDLTFVDDDLNLVSYTGDLSVSDYSQRYRRFYPNRFQRNAGSTALDGGVGRAGLQPAIIAREEVIRLCKRYTSYLLCNDVIKRVLSVTGGSSVRAINKFIAEAWRG